MAALRIFARSTISPILSTCGTVQTLNHVPSTAYQVQKRWNRYGPSPVYNGQNSNIEFDISKDPNEWKYVDRVLPYKIVPDPPTENKEYTSGWKPVTASPKDHPYFIQRTKNHLQPLYLIRKCRGTHRITCVRKIQGNIWALEEEIKNMLEESTGEKIPTKINELAGIVKFRGDHVAAIKKWMDSKGF